MDFGKNYIEISLIIQTTCWRKYLG